MMEIHVFGTMERGKSERYLNINDTFFCRHCCIGYLVTIILCIQILWLPKLQGWYFL